MPVPILFAVAIIILLVGTDHPNGKWSDRHKMNTSLPSTAIMNGTPRASEDVEASREMPAPGADMSRAEKIDVEKNAVNVDVKEVMPSGMYPDVGRIIEFLLMLAW